jgi:tRNA(Ile)-lysidine synthase
MIEEVAQFIQQEQLIPQKNTKVYAAVSGGVDSVVLLDVLYRLRDRFAFNLEILHYNHQVRGKASNADERFVEKLAQTYQLKIHLGKLDYFTKKITETYLREKRYQFFKKYLKTGQQVLIATGHHQDDNLETFIMRFAKGSRLKGLLSILPKRGNYIKPLLKQNKERIITYARKRGLEFRQDESNFDNRIIRNKIRNKILPFLQRELNREIKVNMEKIIEDLFDYYRLYEQVLHQAVNQAVKKSKSHILLNRKRYCENDPLLRRGLVEYCISSAYPLNYSLSKRNFNNWDNFIHEASPGKRYVYMDNSIALAERNHILFGEMPVEKKEQYLLSPGNDVQIDDRYKVCMSRVSAEEVRYSENPNIEYVDGDKSGADLVVRFWQKGDIFRPLGMVHRRKLSDFFIDLKLSIRRKKEIPLVCKEDKIIWIAGYRLDDYFKIAPSTRIFYKLELKNSQRSYN